MTINTFSERIAMRQFLCHIGQDCYFEFSHILDLVENDSLEDVGLAIPDIFSGYATIDVANWIEEMEAMVRVVYEDDEPRRNTKAQIVAMKHTLCNFEDPKHSYNTVLNQIEDGHPGLQVWEPYTEDAIDLIDNMNNLVSMCEHEYDLDHSTMRMAFS